MATAQLQYRVNGGALHEDSTEVSSGDVITLTAASFAGWGQPAARWEIVAFPPDWPAPSGWSTDASSGAYYYLANTGSSGVTPPSITIPDPATYWGKWLFRLTVNGTEVSDKIGVETISPNLELHDLAVGEGRQWGGNRGYVGDHQDGLRKIEDAALVSGAYVASITATTPIARDVATGAVTLSWNPTASVAMGGYGFTGCTGLANAGGAVAVSAGSGNLTLDASAEVDVGGTSATLVKVGRSGQTVRLPARAGVGTRYVTVDASGNLGDTASAGASSTAAYWEDATTALNTNGIPTRAVTAMLTVANAAASSVVPLRVQRVHSAAADDVQDALVIARDLDGGSALAGLGAAIRFDGIDSDGNEINAARIGYALTDETGVSLAAKLQFEAAVAGSLSTLGWWDGDGLHVSTDLIVAGTTTTVDSTSVSLADRLVVFNSSDLAVVPVPVNIAGFVIDRGSADGVAKRDAPGVFWDEANSRFDFAYNTALDQSTIGAFVAVKLKALTVSDFSTGIVHADASGVLSSSLIVNADVDAAAAIAGTKISPDFGAQNVTTTGTLTAGAATITVDDATNNDVTTLLTLTHTTSGSPAANIGGRVVFRTEDSAGSTDDAAYITAIHTTATSGNEASEIGLWIRTGGGAPSKGAYLSPSAPSLGGVAWVASTLMADSGNGLQLRGFSSGAGSTGVYGGVTYDGTNNLTRLFGTGSGQGVALRTNSTYRTIIDASGNQTHTMPATSKIRREWGNAGVNCIDDAADVQTTTDDTPTNVWTLAMDDNSAVKVEVHVWAYDTGTPSNRAWFGVRGGFARNGGGATEDFVHDIHTKEEIGGWGLPLTVDIVVGPGANDVSVQVTGLAGTSIKWITQVTYRLTTTSA